MPIAKSEELTVDRRRRVALAISSAPLRAALSLWLKETNQAILVPLAGNALADAGGQVLSLLVAEVAAATPTLSQVVEALVRPGSLRVIIVTYYADAWRRALPDARVVVLDLATVDELSLRAAFELTEDGSPRSVAAREGRVRHLLDVDARIVELVASGGTNNEIAYRLGISSRTVQLHVSKLMHALNVPSRPALIAELLARGVVTPAANTHTWGSHGGTKIRIVP